MAYRPPGVPSSVPSFFRPTVLDKSRTGQLADATGDFACLVFVLLAASARLRGNDMRLEKSGVKYDLRKFSFSNRVVNIWNSLPNWVVSANTTNTFKTRLDKFWHNQDVL